MAKKKLTKTQPSLRKKKGSKGNKGSAFVTVMIVALITVLVGIILLGLFGEKITPYLFPERIFKPSAKKVTLYFSNEEGIALRGEKRKIPKGDLKKEIMESIEDLIKGPTSDLTITIPDGTRLLGVEIKKDIAVVNFSKEIMENHPGGSSAEIQTVYSIVNTITLNFPDIKEVQILIEGKKVKTLAGHIDISFPLGPNKEYIQG